MPFTNPHPLYSVWRGMISRCCTRTNRAFQNYGGRGIKVCDEWRHDFHRFVLDMGDRPHGHSLDRINNDGDYAPNNCRWTNKTEQQRNQRVTRKIVLNGVQYIAAELAERSGLKTDTLIIRAKTATSIEELLNPQRRVYKAGLAMGGAANGKKKREKTHCANGHEFTASNTSITKEGWRSCKECHRLREIERRSRLKK